MGSKELYGSCSLFCGSGENVFSFLRECEGTVLPFGHDALSSKEC